MSSPAKLNWAIRTPNATSELDLSLGEWVQSLRHTGDAELDNEDINF
jgi:hypothetical protein